MAAPRTGVTRVGVFANTNAPVPVSFVTEVKSWREVMESVAVPYSVPDVGSVTDVLPVVRRESAFVAEKVMTSPPPSVMAFVARVVESETVRVFPLDMVRVPVDEVMVNPLTVVTVATPSVGVTKVGEVS